MSGSAEAGFEIAPNVGIGDGAPLAILSGPCVVEDAQVCLEIAAELKAVCRELGLGYVFKASFDKANRTSGGSFRGPGLEAGLEVLRQVKEAYGVPIVTDVHESWQVEPVAAVADIIQIPAFLCRQTDLLQAAGRSGRAVNVKKGQFMAPEDMEHAVAKVRQTGAERVILTERGTSLGYHNLVVDMRGLVIMRRLGVPVVFDATHSVQLPGGQGTASGGAREFVRPLARAAVAVGVDGLFLETHPCPDKARCDGPNSVPLAEMAALLKEGKRIHELGRESAAD